MLDSRVMLYIVAEMAVLLFFVCLFLIYHINSLRKLVARLEEKINALRISLSGAKKEAMQAREELAGQVIEEPKEYLDYIDDEIENTREFHQGLNPDRDIVLDITPDAPMERQAASLRHAFLIAEKEARYAGEDDKPSWDVLQAKLRQIIEFYANELPGNDSGDGENGPEEEEVDDSSVNEELQAELETYRKRVENLERFKSLFFDMESKWEAACKDADSYYEQLMQLGLQLGGGEHYKSLLDGMSQTFDSLADTIQEGVGHEVPTSIAGRQDDRIDVDVREKPSVGKLVIANQEEIQRLKNMAVDQHKVITDLKRQLREAATQEDFQSTVDDLVDQVERQERFIKEAETCAQLLEDELTRVMEENRVLREQLENQREDDSGKDDDSGNSETMSAEERNQIENLIGDMTNESKEMLETIATLENQNRALKEQLKKSGREESEKKVTILKEKLTAMQQELLNLQTQHIELEERYLEIKSKR